MTFSMAEEPQFNPARPELIGKRIRMTRDQRGRSQQSIADAVGVSKQTVSRWETGEMRPTHENLKLLGEVLGVSWLWLLEGAGHPEGTPREAARQRFIPVIDLRDAATWLDRPSGAPRGAESAIATIEPASSVAFAVHVEDDAMAPDFLRGDLVVIDPAASPQPGDFVLAEIRGQAVLRRFRPRDLAASRIDLLASNSDWPPIEISVDKIGRIIGTFVELRRVPPRWRQRS